MANSIVSELLKQLQRKLDSLPPGFQGVGNLLAADDITARLQTAIYIATSRREAAERQRIHSLPLRRNLAAHILSAGLGMGDDAIAVAMKISVRKAGQLRRGFDRRLIAFINFRRVRSDTPHGVCWG